MITGMMADMKMSHLASCDRQQRNQGVREPAALNGKGGEQEHLANWALPSGIGAFKMLYHTY